LTIIGKTFIPGEQKEFPPCQSDPGKGPTFIKRQVHPGTFKKGTGAGGGQEEKSGKRGKEPLIGRKK